MTDEAGFDRAVEIAEAIFARVRKAQRGEPGGLALPPLETSRQVVRDGKKRTEKVMLPLASEAGLLAEAERVTSKGRLQGAETSRETPTDAAPNHAYKFEVGVMFSRSRGYWVPSFRVFSPAAPRGRTEQGERRWPGSRRIKETLFDTVADIDPNIGPIYYSTVSLPGTLSRPDAAVLNGSARKDWIYPGAGVAPTVRGPNSSCGYFVVERHQIPELRNRLRHVTAGDLTLKCLEFDKDGQADHVLVVPRSRVEEDTLHAVLSGHGATNGGTVGEDGSRAERSQFRVYDERPGGPEYQPKTAEDFGHLVRAKFPQLNVSSGIDSALVKLTAKGDRLYPSLMAGNPDRTLAGLVLNPEEQLPSLEASRQDGPTQVPVKVRGLGSGVVPGFVTCVRTTVTGYDHDGLPLRYETMIEVIGQTHLVGHAADSGGPVVVEGEGNRDYLLGTMCLGARRAYELSRYFQLPANANPGVTYLAAAHTQLEQFATMLVVE